MQSRKCFPVRFSQAQRRVIADLLPALVDRLKLHEKNQRMISLTLDEIKTIHEKAKPAIRKTTDGMKRNSLQCVVDIAAEGLDSFQGIGAIAVSERLFQFRITLKDLQPAIWRRIQVRDATVDKLHEHVQTSMGWTNSHLHEFQVNGARYGDLELLDDGFEDFECIDSRVTRISEIVPKSGERFRFEYQYDFGDGWEHEILFEGCLRAVPGARYPICVEGERACPPEDVGGVWGYPDFLEAIADPDNEDHDRLLEWSGPFDPNQFDAEKATRSMRRGLPSWR